MAIPSNAHLIWHPFVGFCQHEDLLPPAAAPAFVKYIDFGVVHGATGLFAWPTAHFPYPFAKKPDRGEILAMGVPIEGRSTDATLLVPHVPVLPLAPGYLLGLIILFGSSKFVIASNRTRIWCKGLAGAGEQEQAVGCCVFPNFPMSLNLQCWDLKSKSLDKVSPPLPTDIVYAPNTVQVGIEFADYLAAIIDWAIEVVLAIVVAFGVKKGGDAWAKRAASKAAAKAASGAAAKTPGAFSRFIAKPAAQKWVLGLGVKLPLKLLNNTQWVQEKREWARSQPGKLL